MRQFAIAISSMMVATVSMTSAAVVTLDPALHPTQSAITMTLQIAGTNAMSSIGPIPISGTMIVDINLDGSGNGTVQIISADIDIQNFGPALVDLDPFGALDAELDSLHLIMNTGVMTVLNNQFTIDGSVSGSIGVDGGMLIATNATGFLGSALGPDPDDINLATDPAIVGFTDLVNPAMGFVDHSPMNLVNGPELSVTPVTVFNVASGVLLIVSAELNLGAPVPEVGSALMIGILLGSGGLGYAVRRRSH